MLPRAAVKVFLLALEAQRIGGDRGRRQFGEAAGIEGIGEALGRADAHMMVAIGADVQIGHQVAVEDHLAAGRTLLPKVLRRIAAALALVVHQALDPGSDDVRDPVHAGTLP
jgi:hypothetical protein